MGSRKWDVVVVIVLWSMLYMQSYYTNPRALFNARGNGKRLYFTHTYMHTHSIDHQPLSLSRDKTWYICIMCGSIKRCSFFLFTTFGVNSITTKCCLFGKTNKMERRIEDYYLILVWCEITGAWCTFEDHCVLSFMLLYCILNGFREKSMQSQIK